MSTTKELREFWLNLQGKTAFEYPTSPGYIRRQRIAAWVITAEIVALLVLLVLWVVH